MLRRHTKISISHSIHSLTTVTDQRGNWFVQPSLCVDILEIFERARHQLGVACFGYVLMPDHFHVLTMQTTDGLQISKLMRRFKSKTSVRCRPLQYDADVLWHRRYDDVPVPGSHAVLTKLNYIHQNPVKKKLAPTASAYPWSSARDYELNQHGTITIARDILGTIPL